MSQQQQEVDVIPPGTPEYDDYEELLKKRQASERTSLALRGDELQRFITAVELDPSILRSVPAYREMEGALGMAEANLAVATESSWFHESVNAAYGPYTRFNQKIGIAVDVLTKASINRLALHTRRIDLMAKVANQRRRWSVTQIAVAGLLLMVVGAILFIPGNAAGFATWASSAPYGFPNSYLLMAMVGIVVYFGIIRKNRPEKSEL